MKFKAIGINQLDSIEQLKDLPAEYTKVLKAVSMVLPFRANNYIVDELIDWNNIPEDPIFQLTFPQPGMLKKEYLDRILDLIDSNAPESELNRLINRIREEMNPHPAMQVEMNVPRERGKEHRGMQHKYPETVLLFPKQGQICSAYCTYCFRWAQFSGMEDLHFSASDPFELVRYLESHPLVTDVLITGGDPLTMSTRLLRQYIEPLLRKPGNLRSIRIGTKFLSFWPYRFTADRDAEDLLDLFREIIDGGIHLAIMGHFTHYRELETEAVSEAVKAIRETGAEIRSQSPVVKHINDSADVWSSMWQKQVEMGIIPYYMFMARNTGAKEYFSVTAADAYDIYSEAISRVSGLGRTVRGPVMSCSPGKVLIDGVAEIGGDQVFALKFLQGRNPDWVNRLFFAEYDKEADWMNQLQPFRKDEFFYEEEYEEMKQQALKN
ncbi:MAG: lysine 2,3-aminomutase [Spirochaetales bacterium]|nr:lysine 2,3-aminomutase [Spirochaetales bacterium]